MPKSLLPWFETLDNKRSDLRPLANAVKHFVAERREPSGGFCYWTNRRARALPLKSFEFPSKKMLHSVGPEEQKTRIFKTRLRGTIQQVPDLRFGL
jgi:hypothetical protein